MSGKENKEQSELQDCIKKRVFLWVYIKRVISCAVFTQKELFVQVFLPQSSCSSYFVIQQGLICKKLFLNWKSVSDRKE